MSRRLYLLHAVIALAGMLVTGWLAAFFFVGSEETFRALKARMPLSLLKRIMGGWFFALPFVAALWLVNYTYGKKCGDRRALNRLTLLSSIIVLLGTVAGSVYFFYGK